MIIAKPNRERVCFFGTAYFLTCSNVFKSQFLEYRFSAYVFGKHMGVVNGSKALNVLMRFLPKGMLLF